MSFRGVKIPGLSEPTAEASTGFANVIQGSTVTAMLSEKLLLPLLEGAADSCGGIPVAAAAP